MSDVDRTLATADGPDRRRPPGSRIAELGDRLARTFGSAERADRTEHADRYLRAWDDTDVEPDPEWPQTPARFPGARHGYDRTAVDDYVAQLESELASLRAHKPTKTAVAHELEQIGEQAAAILRVAHEQAHTTTRRAQAQADKCLSDAAAQALTISDDARLKVRDLDRETDMIWRERARLIEDVRNVATTLLSVAEEASERFPAEAERANTAPAPLSDLPEEDRFSGHVSDQTEDQAPPDDV